MIDMVLGYSEKPPGGGAPSRHQRDCNHDGLDRARACGLQQNAF
jgi:hypothetical protein